MNAAQGDADDDAARWRPRWKRCSVLNLAADMGGMGFIESNRSPPHAQEPANFTGLVLGCIEAKFCK